MTEPWVPTGMKTGVGMSAWGVERIPARALLSGHWAAILNIGAERFEDPVRGVESACAVFEILVGAF